MKWSRWKGMEKTFELIAPFEPSGDQPDAIEKLANGIENSFTMHPE